VIFKGEFVGSAKKIKQFYLFITILAIPLIGAMVIFSLLYINTKKDLELTTHQLKGLDIILDIQKSIHLAQKIRGLSLIANIDEPNSKKLSQFESKFTQNNIKISKKLNAIKKEDKLKTEMIEFVDGLIKSDIYKLKRDDITKIIERFLSYELLISHHCELILESDSSRYLLVENALLILPKLVELNAQLRAMVIDGIPSDEQLHILTSKIDDLFKKFVFNCDMLKRDEEFFKIEEVCIDVSQTQKEIVDFINQGSLNNSNEIFNRATDYIDSMIEANGKTLSILRYELEQKRGSVTRTIIYIVIFGVLAIIFISVVNRIFYLTNKNYIDKIKSLTITDSLTSLYNRRFFDETSQKYLDLYRRLGLCVNFIMLDIDFFKQYNDTYGHQKGDEALVSVAKVLKDHAKRSSDKAFRLGGEEFGVLFISKDKEDAKMFAEHLRAEVEALKIEHKQSDVSRYLSISIGLVSLDRSIANKADLYKQADTALYEAKNSGRNRVVSL
jgi:diguanylate cyclase (GGDEF)-like protein